MTELVEYTLVVLVSALFVGGSVLTYDRFNSFAAGLQLRLDSASIGKLADKAVTEGSAKAQMSMPASTISCRDGVLNLTSSGLTRVQSVPAECDFDVAVQGGERILSFSFSDSKLTLAAT